MTLPASASIASLAAYGTPTICNALERFNLRLRNEGYMNAAAVYLGPPVIPMVGYAITIQMRTEKPPVKGFSYPDRSDWWEIIASAPTPKVIVIQDTDAMPGTGSVTGDVHAGIFKALGCVGIITNGAVRDLEALTALRMHIHAGGISPSHAYAHIVDVGNPVTIGNMTIRTGDLLHGDQHGVVSIPTELVQEVEDVARDMMEHERRIQHFCSSPEFSVAGLREMVSAFNTDSVSS